MNATGAPQVGHHHFLDALRGLASLWVVFNHTEQYLPNSLDRIPAAIREPLIMHGNGGVPVFFVLSGFVIAHSLRHTVMYGPGFGNFMTRRLVRLSPPYYAAVVFALVVNFVSTVAKSETFDPPSVLEAIAHVLYLPDLLNMPMVNGVHWTLYVEVQFYLLYGLLLWGLARVPDRSWHRHWIALTVLAAASLVPPLFALREGRENWFGPYVHAFVFGVLIQWTRSKRLPPVVLGAFTAGLGFAWALHQDRVAGAGFVAGLIVLATTGPRGARGLLEQGPFQFLGRISFSLYLVHSPVMGAVSWLGGKVLGVSMAAELATMAAAIVASIVVSAVFYRLFEQPALEWSRRLRRRTPATGDVAVAT